MKRLLVFAVLCAVSTFAQQTRKEITKPTTQHDDSKPNDPSIPDVYALSGNFERVVVLRFKYKADLLAGIQKGVADEKIKHGVILAGAGSVRNYHVHGVSNREFPSKNVYIKDPTHPADIVSMNGYIIDGRVHAHLTLADDNQAFGGHLEPDTNVFTFAIVTIGVLKDIDLARVDDKTYR